MVTSAFLDYVMLCLGILSVSAFVGLSYKLFVTPARKIRNLRLAPPVEGYEYPIIFHKHQTLYMLRIGLLYSDINLRLRGIKENHLIIKIRKEPDLEEYDFMLNPNGVVFLQAPHTRHKEHMKGRDRFSSSELIGNSAKITLAAALIEGRPARLIEFELLSDYFYNSDNIEQMKFTLCVTKIAPKVDLDSRDKKGIYSFHSTHD